MQIALYDNKSVYADEALIEYGKKQGYVCPCCKEKVILKAGTIKFPYFSHLKDSTCSYNDYKNEMSEWHKYCQSLFPKEYREVIITKKLADIFPDDDFEDDETETHIADICYKNYIIEFQHSYMDAETFDDRTNFYLKSGYKLIWVFDWTDKIDDIDFYETYDDISKCRVKRAPTTCKFYRPQDYKNNLMICFAYYNDDEEDENYSYLERIIRSKPKYEYGYETDYEADYSRIVTKNLDSIEKLAQYILSK